jgi:Ricin-type beta-trefoil lectin domain
LGGTFNQRQLGLRDCSGTITDPIQHQRFQLTYFRDIEYEQELCFDTSAAILKGPIILMDCHSSQGNQYWRYDPVSIFFFKETDETKIFLLTDNQNDTEG